VNPQLATGRTDSAVHDTLYDKLTHRDAQMNLVPGLATEWKLLNDTTWQFKLRQGVKFHNGDPFTAADVKFSIERTYDPEAKTVVANVFTTVDRIEVVDDYTINFIMKKPDPLLPARHAGYGGYIMPAKYFQQVGPDEFDRKPVGNGPFKVVEWVKDDHLTFEANKEYWGGPPNVDSIVMRPRPETASRVGGLLAGDLTFIDEVRPDEVDRINKSANARVESGSYAGHTQVNVNSKVPPFDNKYFKQALSLAINRKAIVDDLFVGQGRVPNGSIPQGEFAYNPNLPPLPYDPQKAKELLQQAGYRGQEIAFEGQEPEMPWVEAVAAMWKSVGINVKYQVIEPSVYVQQIRDKSFKGAFTGGATSTLGDPDGTMWRLLGPGGLLDYWRDPEFDRLGEEARFSLDQDLRRKNYERMNEILIEHNPWIPILSPNKLYGMQKFVQWRPYPNARLDFRRENLSIAG
jgi:peptide/nickel transport system substrate-binding protein